MKTNIKFRVTIVDSYTSISNKNYEGYVYKFNYLTERWDIVFSKIYSNRFWAYLCLSHFIRKYNKFNKFLNKNTPDVTDED